MTRESIPYNGASNDVNAPQPTKAPSVGVLRRQEGLLSADEEKRLRHKSLRRAISVCIALTVYSSIICSLVWISYEVILGEKFTQNALKKISPGVFGLICAAILGAVICRNVGLYVVNWHNWRVSTKSAQNIADVESVVDGFTSLFRRYVKTKAAGYYAYLWFSWGLLTTIFFLISGLSSNLVRLAVGLVVLESLIIVVLGVALSTTFRIGLVLVDFLGVIAYRSAHQMHTDAAQTNTKEIAIKHRRLHYWLFY